MAFAGKVLTLGCLLGFGVSGFNLGFRVEGSGYPLSFAGIDLLRKKSNNKTALWVQNVMNVA